MCKGIRELEAKSKAEGKAEGILLMLLQLVCDGLLDSSIAAERTGMSEDAFRGLVVEKKQGAVVVNADAVM